MIALDFGVLGGLVVAVVLLMSGVAKLWRVSSFQTALIRTFGIRAGIARVVGILVPGCELAVAILLLVPETRVVGSALAVILLSTITLVAYWAWVMGRKGDCGCWGGAHAEALGPMTVLRGGLLTGTATLSWLAQALSI